VERIPHAPAAVLNLSGMRPCELEECGMHGRPSRRVSPARESRVVKEGVKLSKMDCLSKSSKRYDFV
jgi:hypothetical protein